MTNSGLREKGGRGIETYLSSDSVQISEHLAKIYRKISMYWCVLRGQVRGILEYTIHDGDLSDMKKKKKKKKKKKGQRKKIVRHTNFCPILLPGLSGPFLPILSNPVLVLQKTRTVTPVRAVRNMPVLFYWYDV